MAVKLNASGETHLKTLIDAGKYTTADGWDFTAEDGDALLGDKGDDWTRYASVHLGVDDAEADNTKGRWKYPAGKAKGDSEEVSRGGLVAAKDRAAGQGEKDIEDAASRLIDAIDKKEGDAPGGDKPAAETRADAPRARVRATDLPHVMARIFDTPLLIDSGKLDVILSSLGPRLNLLMAPAYVLPAMKGAPEIALKPGRLELLDAEAQMIVGAFGADDDENDDCPYDVTQDGIALISIDGTLVYKSSWLGALSGMTSYSSIADAVNQAIADPSVKGILLQVGSYGGEANGCFDASDAIFAARAQKPVYGVATDMSYSGGYALLSAASRIFVSRTSGVGSIGVCCAHVDQSAQDKMDGLKYTYVYSGDRKIDGNPHQALSPEARAEMQTESDRLRSLFAASVAKYRGLSVDAVLATQAAKYFGENAVAAKLADAIGTPADALAALRAEIATNSTTASMPAPQAGRVEGEKPAAAVEAAPATAQPRSSSEAVAHENVINLDAVRESVRGESASHHVEIVELCALAEAPQLAADFIRNRVSIADVRERLQVHRAQVSDARPISGHILPDADDHNPKTAGAGWEKAIRATCGKLKGE